MNWLKKLFKKIFSKNKIDYLPEPIIEETKSQKNNFRVNLKSSSDLERDDRNGYRIRPNLRLKDMI